MVSEKKKASNKRYDEKTYTRIIMNFRTEDDAEFLKVLQDARNEGIPYREVLSEWFKAYKKTCE